MTTYRRITIPEVKAACDKNGLQLKPGITHDDGACCPIVALAIANGIEDYTGGVGDEYQYADPLLLADGLGYDYQYADGFVMGFDGWPTDGASKAQAWTAKEARKLGYSDGIAVRLALCPNEPLAHEGPLDDQDSGDQEERQAD